MKIATTYSASPCMWQTFARCFTYIITSFYQKPVYRWGTETQRSEVTGPRWHSYEVIEQGLFHSKALIRFWKNPGGKSIRDLRKQKKNLRDSWWWRWCQHQWEIVALHRDSCGVINHLLSGKDLQIKWEVHIQFCFSKNEKEWSLQAWIPVSEAELSLVDRLLKFFPPYPHASQASHRRIFDVFDFAEPT